MSIIGMNNSHNTLLYQQVKDKLLYDLAPVLAKHYSSVLSSEQAFKVADLTVDFIDTTIASVIE